MRLFHVVPLSLISAACLLSVACGDTVGGDEGDPGIPLEAMPAKYAASACAGYLSCAGDLLAAFRPGEDCAEKTTAQVTEELASLEEAVAAKRVRYDGTKLQACLDELSARTCAELLTRESEVCRLALDGTLAKGEACSLDAECEGQAYCSFNDSCPGACAALETAGGGCRGDSDCASGLVCFSETSRCVAPAGKGELCQQGEPDCAPGHGCLGEDGEAKTPGTCVALDEAFSAKLGEACSLATQLCEPGKSCEVQAVVPQLTTECVAKVASGAACGVAIPDECPDSEYCVVPPLALRGTCRPRPEAGEPCGVASYDRQGTPSLCAAYARCDQGVCRDLANLGETCSADDTCYSGRCADAACVSSSGCY